MKLELLPSELQSAITKTARMYDTYVAYIDDGYQYAQTIQSNKDIVEKLAYFGFDINLNEIEPQTFAKLYSGQFCDLLHEDTAVAQKLETLERCTKAIEEDPRKTYLVEAIAKSKFYTVKTTIVRVSANGYLEFHSTTETRNTLDYKGE